MEALHKFNNAYKAKLKESHDSLYRLISNDLVEFLYSKIKNVNTTLKFDQIVADIVGRKIPCGLIKQYSMQLIEWVCNIMSITNDLKKLPIGHTITTYLELTSILSNLRYENPELYLQSEQLDDYASIFTCHRFKILLTILPPLWMYSFGCKSIPKSQHYNKISQWISDDTNKPVDDEICVEICNSMIDIVIEVIKFGDYIVEYFNAPMLLDYALRVLCVLDNETADSKISILVDACKLLPEHYVYKAAINVFSSLKDRRHQRLICLFLKLVCKVESVQTLIPELYNSGLNKGCLKNLLMHLWKHADIPLPIELAKKVWNISVKPKKEKGLSLFCILFALLLQKDKYVSYIIKENTLFMEEPLYSKELDTLNLSKTIEAWIKMLHKIIVFNPMLELPITRTSLILLIRVHMNNKDASIKKKASQIIAHCIKITPSIASSLINRLEGSITEYIELLSLVETLAKDSVDTATNYDYSITVTKDGHLNIAQAQTNIITNVQQYFTAQAEEKRKQITQAVFQIIDTYSLSNITYAMLFKESVNTLNDNKQWKEKIEKSASKLLKTIEGNPSFCIYSNDIEENVSLFIAQLMEFHCSIIEKILVQSDANILKALEWKELICKMINGNEHVAMGISLLLNVIDTPLSLCCQMLPDIACDIIPPAFGYCISLDHNLQEKAFQFANTAFSMIDSLPLQIKCDIISKCKIELMKSMSKALALSNKQLLSFVLYNLHQIVKAFINILMLTPENVLDIWKALSPFVGEKDPTITQLMGMILSEVSKIHENIAIIYISDLLKNSSQADAKVNICRIVKRITTNGKLSNSSSTLLFDIFIELLAQQQKTMLVDMQISILQSIVAEVEQSHLIKLFNHFQTISIIIEQPSLNLLLGVISAILSFLPASFIESSQQIIKSSIGKWIEKLEIDEALKKKIIG